MGGGREMEGGREKNNRRVKALSDFVPLLYYNMHTEASHTGTPCKRPLTQKRPLKKLITQNYHVILLL